MITVAKLREELEKFPDDAVCFAYEGEVIGIVIERPGERMQGQGVIYCSESEDVEPDTLPLPPVEPKTPAFLAAVHKARGGPPPPPMMTGYA
jgi:hypothetical protein